MEESSLSESQIVSVLKEAAAAELPDDLIRAHGFSKASFYKWKAKYGGISIAELKRLEVLQEENRHLTRMYANLSLEHASLGHTIENNHLGGIAARVGQVCYSVTWTE